MGNPVDIKESLRLIEGFAIPTRPLIMLEALKTQNTFVQNLEEVTSTILHDMALSALVLSSANTLLAGYNRRVNSIECAVILLGQEKLRDITHELFMTARIAGKDSLKQKICLQGVKTAKLMVWLVQEMAVLSPHYKNSTLPEIPADEAYVVGLFHDCGQLVFLQHFSDYPHRMAERDKISQTLEDAETEMYQTNHAVLGSLLCNAWKLPKLLAQIIGAHHHIEAFAVGKAVKDRKFVAMHALLFLAEFIEKEILEWEWQKGQDYFCQFFDLEPSQIAPLCAKAREHFSLDKGQPVI